MPDYEKVICETIRELVARQTPGPVDLTLNSDIFDELGMDSLEVAELSAVLEETFGTDPDTEGQLARAPRAILTSVDGFVSPEPPASGPRIWQSALRGV